MILVTGGSGMVGRAISSHLERAHQEVVTFSSADLDLRDFEATLKVFRELRPTKVFHAAARVHGIMGNLKFPGEMFTDNVRINLNVIEAARMTGVTKINAIGTVATYNENVTMPAEPSAIWDGPPHASEASYGHAKRAMLAQLESYEKQYGLEFSYIVLTNVYGPHDRFDPEHGHVIPSLVAKFRRAVLERKPVEIWGSGVAERDFIFSEDAAKAIVLVGDNLCGAVNVAVGETVQIKNVVEELQEISGVQDVLWDTTKPDGQLRRSYNTEPLRGTGFVPGFSLKDGLARTYNWYEENQDVARH